MSDEQSALNAHIHSVTAALGKASEVRQQLTRIAESTATLTIMVHQATGGATSLSENGATAATRALTLHANLVNLNVDIEQLDEALVMYLREITGG